MVRSLSRAARRLFATSAFRRGPASSGEIAPRAFASFVVVTEAPRRPGALACRRATGGAREPVVSKTQVRFRFYKRTPRATNIPINFLNSKKMVMRERRGGAAAAAGLGVFVHGIENTIRRRAYEFPRNNKARFVSRLYMPLTPKKKHAAALGPTPARPAYITRGK